MPNSIKDDTLTGSIDFDAGTLSITANYTAKSTGAVYTYSISGTIVEAEPEPCAQEDGEPFEPPDPAHPEAADADTTCDDTSNCDVGLSCLTCSPEAICQTVCP